MKPAIRIDGLSKQYRLGSWQVGSYRDLREAIAQATTAPFRRWRRRTKEASAAKTIWALRDVSFEVEPGQVVGIIGRNGAGKSTLLKVLSRIVEPTTGRAEVRGRLASLLEVGTGFHQDLTGRENIFLNGSLLGMTRREIQRKLDEIVAFSEIEQFLDTPVKRYSSGMYVRLAFAVAAHLESEILIVDEVLAVGDVEFQRKCLGKMQDVGRAGRTVLFVSHNMASLQVLCQRGILLSAGKLVEDAPIEQAIATYLNTLGRLALTNLAERTDRSGTGRSRAQRLEILGDRGGTPGVVTLGRPARFVLHVDRYLPGLFCILAVADQYGHVLTRFSDRYASSEDGILSEASPQFVCDVEEWLLAPGRYRIDVTLWTTGELQDHVEGAAFFEVERGTVRGREAPRGQNDWKVTMPHRWLVPGR